DDFIAVEGEYSKFSVGPQFLTVNVRTQCFGCIFDKGNFVGIAYFPDSFNLGGHPIEMNHDTSFRLFAPGYTVFNCLLKFLWIHIPGALFRIYKDGQSTLIGDRVGTGRKAERLAQYFIVSMDDS